jgi:predicted RNase H-like HicB family nuclease
MSELKNKEDFVKEYSRFVTWDDHDQIYVVRIPELPGCVTHGSTTIEALEMSDEAVLAYLETLESLGRPFPVPASRVSEEQKFVLRLDLPTHQLVKFAAEELGVSMNEYIAERLAGSYHVIDADDPDKINRAYREHKMRTASRKQPVKHKMVRKVHKRAAAKKRA